MTSPAIEMSPLPRVQGRHRNRALAGRRRVRALQLLSEGLSYQQVADELGYANKGTVHHLVQQELGAQVVESVAELRQSEVARLDALQVVLWDLAMSGDLQAAKVVVGIILARCRVLGLLSTTSRELARATSNCGPRTLVISPTAVGIPAAQRMAALTSPAFVGAWRFTGVRDAGDSSSSRQCRWPWVLLGSPLW